MISDQETKSKNWGVVLEGTDDELSDYVKKFESLHLDMSLQRILFHLSGKVEANVLKSLITYLRSQQNTQYVTVPECKYYLSKKLTEMVFEGPNSKQAWLDIQNTLQEVVSLRAPPEWLNLVQQKVEKKNLALHDVQPDTPEYRFVEQKLRTGLPNARITRLRMVQNLKLWEKYATERRHMLDKHGDQLLNEQFLWHGCKAGDASLIYDCEEGFDIRKAQSSNCGFGTYFASNPGTSIGYNHGQIILAKVLLGRTTSQRCINSREPPIYSGIIPYDSFSNGNVSVIFANRKCYPFYVVDIQNDYF